MSFESCFKILSILRDSNSSASADARQRFRRAVRSYYRSSGRDFPWRRTRDPYQILVSEIMLQQTQTQRVAERFPIFIRQFPDVYSLAAASQSEVIRAWEGLGYYRRARNLHQASQEIVRTYGGELPTSYELLRGLPGIGDYTAAAVSAFAFERAVPMIETNIRAVYLYVFFQKQQGVSDREILTVVEETMPRRSIREWFYALMDIGVELKKVAPRINHSSLHHTKQKPFHGSDRRVAALILRRIVASGRPVSKDLVLRTVQKEISDVSVVQIERALTRLQHDRLIVRTTSGLYSAA